MQAVDSPSDKAVSLDELVWEHIERVLAAHEGNVSAAARALGMHRRTLQRKLQRHARRLDSQRTPA